MSRINVVLFEPEIPGNTGKHHEDLRSYWVYITFDWASRI